MMTEPQPTATTTNGSSRGSFNNNNNSSSSSGPTHQKKTGGRNASSRHSSACGGGWYNSNGESGGMPFMPADVPLIAPHLLAAGFYQQPTALYEYGMLNSPDVNAWAAGPELLIGGHIYDPSYTGGFLSPTLVNPAAFTPVGGPNFAYDANELFTTCGMTPTPTGVPSFPFDPNTVNLATSWDGFTGTNSSDFPPWSASGNPPDAATATAGADSLLLSTSSQSSSNQVTNTVSRSSNSARQKNGSLTTTSAASKHSAEQLTSQLSLLRVANASSSHNNGSNSSYASVLTSKATPADLGEASFKQPEPEGEPSSLLSTTPKTAIDTGNSSKTKLLSVAKRREITYAGIVKAGTNDTVAETKPKIVNGPTNNSSHLNFGASVKTQNGSPVTAAVGTADKEEFPEVLLERLKVSVNPATFEVASGSRFFVIKSYSEDDVHRSIKYGIWCSTLAGNQKLDAAYRAVKALADRRSSHDVSKANASDSATVQQQQQQPAKAVVGLTYPITPPQSRRSKHQNDAKQSESAAASQKQQKAEVHHPGVYLFFSVNSSGHFCGIAEMRSAVDYEARAGVWEQDKWRGKFDVHWHFVKDVPNAALRNIRLENNENKPVTNSRDTQEVPIEKARQVLQIFTTYPHTTSLFDDFLHYEKKQIESARARANPASHWNGGPHAHAHLPHVHAPWRTTADDWLASVSHHHHHHPHPHPHQAAEWFPPRQDWHMHGTNAWGVNSKMVAAVRGSEWQNQGEGTLSSPLNFAYMPTSANANAGSDAPPS